jgi:hypothetical protein
MTQETLQKGKAAVAQATQKAEQSFAVGTENFRDLSITLIDMAHANIESAFEFARQAAAARTPGDLATLWSAHVPKQFELLNAQTKELTDLGQKLAIRSAPSITPDR